MIDHQPMRKYAVTATTAMAKKTIAIPYSGGLLA
ncbi:Uncharacterised protein [Mycobacterium tuberculosis]|uniref:Uncharacterized protein n=1 Tax=Mycobacterium tuberculosis TaxID=1773 RepID=A0A654U8V5_MYCTX|nr:Uncharacterised protein [Mycobacterium tuberculosis]